MQNIIHASFANADDGVKAAESLLSHGLRAEEITLILSQSHVHDGAHATAMPTLDFHISRAADANSGVPAPPILLRLPMRSTPHYSGHEAVMAPGATGYTYDELGAVIPDGPPKKGGVSHHTAHAMDHHLDSGRTTLSVTASDAVKNTVIAEVIRKYNGRLIEQPL